MTDLAWVWTSHRIKLKDEEKKLFNFINRRLTVFEGGTLNIITSHNLIKTCISIVGTGLRNVGDKLVISRADYRSTPHKSHGALILNDTPQLNYTTASSSHPQHPPPTPPPHPLTAPFNVKGTIMRRLGIRTIHFLYDTTEAIGRAAQ